VPSTSISFDDCQVILSYDNDGRQKRRPTLTADSVGRQCRPSKLARLYFFIDDLVKYVNKPNVGCRIRAICTAIFLYADDVILLAPSACALQSLVDICASELEFLVMAINVKKSAYMRFGPRYKNMCCEVVVSAHPIGWVESARYLGVYLVSSTKFKCSFSNNKAGFFKAFNSIYGKIGRSASEEVSFELIKSKCLPVLMYGIDVCPINSADRQSLKFTINRIIRKIFGAMTKDSYCEISEYFGIRTVEQLITNRQS